MSISAGMDHDLYPYRSEPARAPLTFPNAANVAFAPIVYLEHWPEMATKDGYADPRVRDPYGAFQPDYRTHTWREYGNRIGIFRIFEALDRYGMTATLAVNASAARRYPVLIDQALSRGWDIAAHGDVADAMVTSRMSEPDEAALIETCLDTLQSVTGTRRILAKAHGRRGYWRVRVLSGLPAGRMTINPIGYQQRRPWSACRKCRNLMMWNACGIGAWRRRVGQR